MQYITSQVEEEEPTGFVRYEKFEPVLCRILLERRYQPVSEEQLLKAFKVIIYIPYIANRSRRKSFTDGQASSNLQNFCGLPTLLIFKNMLTCINNSI